MIKYVESGITSLGQIRTQLKKQELIQMSKNTRRDNNNNLRLNLCSFNAYNHSIKPYTSLHFIKTSILP